MRQTDRLLASLHLPGLVLSVCLVGLLLAGCKRASSLNPGFTTGPLAATSSAPAVTQPAQTSTAPGTSSPAAPEITATTSQTVEKDNVSAAATATEFANQSQQTLTAFPLQVGNSWVYAYQSYSGDEKATWQEVDTVVDMRQLGMLNAYEVQQEISQVQKIPANASINTPEAKNYWYILSGNALYRQWGNLDWLKVESSGLELIWPLPVQGCWFPDPEQRSNPALPVQSDFPGCRSADGPHSLQLPAGNLDHCYRLMTSENDGPTFDDFCEQVGFVGGKFDHAGTPFGQSFQLIAYSLQNK